MSINKDSICLRCKHCRVVSIDIHPGINREIVLVDCTQEVYRFPIQGNSSCPYFENRKGEDDEGGSL